MRIGCAEPMARLIVDKLRDAGATNVAAYVRGMPDDDLREWQQKVLGGGDPAPWDVPGARAPVTARDLHAHRQARQAAIDAARPGAGSVPASAVVQAARAAEVRAALSRSS